MNINYNIVGRTEKTLIVTLIHGKKKPSFSQIYCDELGKIPNFYSYLPFFYNLAACRKFYKENENK